MLAEAMVIEEARVMPPAPPAGTTNDPNALGGQLPGTYPTEKAKLEAALPKFQAAADAYPSSDAGHHRALSRRQDPGRARPLRRGDQALRPGDRQRLGAARAQTARLGKAEAQLRAGAVRPGHRHASRSSSSRRTPTLPAEAVLMELARAYKLAGKTEDARKTLTQIVEQHADSPFATEAKQELEKLKG